MARIRTVKPEVVKHEVLFDAEEETGLPIRFAWVMLPCLCDREGRFKWKPRRMKPDLLPYDEGTDISPVLDAFLTRGLLVKYRVRGEWYGWIPTFTKHQVINNRESKSELPGPEEADEVIYDGNHELDVCATRSARVNDAQGTPTKGKGREGKGKEGEDMPDAGAASNGHDDDPAFLVLPCLKNKTYPITESLVAEYEEDFPAVDVRQELRNAVAWVKANPKKKKTYSGARRFLTGWLTRSQNRGGSKSEPSQPAQDLPDL